MKIYTLTSHVADQLAALEAASQRRRRVLRPLLWTLLLLIPGIVLALVWQGRTQLAGIMGGGGFVALLLLGVIAVTGPSKQDAAIKRAGAAGEAVLPQLLRPLPDTWTLLNGVPTPGAHADIDHVLVGPTGVWAIEAKHHVGMVQCVGDAWGYTRLGAGGIPQEGHIGNPSQQARRAAAALEHYLQRRDLPVSVQPLVVFTHPHVVLTIEEPTLLILRATDVLGFVSTQRPLLSSADSVRVVELIRGLRPLSELDH